jgi:hypothetical protein
MGMPIGRSTVPNCSSKPEPIQRRLHNPRVPRDNSWADKRFRHSAFRITLLGKYKINFCLQEWFQLPGGDQEVTAAKLSWQAAAARRTSSSVWAAETKSASNCEGASRNPRRSISWKNAAKRRVSEVFAAA